MKNIKLFEEFNDSITEFNKIKGYVGVYDIIEELPAADAIKKYGDKMNDRQKEIFSKTKQLVCVTKGHHEEHLMFWPKDSVIKSKLYLTDTEEEKITEERNLVDDFFNKASKELDTKYFPDVKYYRDDKDATAVHYALELFSNGQISKDNLIKRLAKSCKEKEEVIKDIIKKYTV